MATIYGTKYHDDGTWQITDTFPFFQLFPELKGTSSGDRIYGYAGNDKLYGYGGDDYLYGDSGGDRLEGGDGNDFLYGGTENDHLFGQNGNDWLDGGTGDDKLYGHDGHDILNGGAGIDSMTGGTGNDTYYVDTMSDSIYEYLNQGTDTVYSTVSTSVKWLPGNVENLYLQGSAVYGDGNDLNNLIMGNAVANQLYGYGGNDRLVGFEGNDYLSGADGNDSLHGGDGDDSLNGGNGTDGLTGGLGKDTLTGGSGNDFFHFSGSLNYQPYSPSALESLEGVNRDTITDFSYLQNDKIVLTGIDADALAAGYQALEYNDLTFDYATKIFTARVDNGPDLQIQLTGVTNFDSVRDVIIEAPPIFG
jgi:Ca2+-binding RTX toxin-like protein